MFNVWCKYILGVWLLVFLVFWFDLLKILDEDFMKFIYYFDFFVYEKILNDCDVI